jgi:hypothetical protein
VLGVFCVLLLLYISTGMGNGHPARHLLDQQTATFMRILGQGLGANPFKVSAGDAQHSAILSLSK